MLAKGDQSDSQTEIPKKISLGDETLKYLESVFRHKEAMIELGLDPYQGNHSVTLTDASFPQPGSIEIFLDEKMQPVQAVYTHGRFEYDADQPQPAEWLEQKELTNDPKELQALWRLFNEHAQKQGTSVEGYAAKKLANSTVQKQPGAEIDTKAGPLTPSIHTSVAKDISTNPYQWILRAHQDQSIVALENHSRRQGIYIKYDHDLRPTQVISAYVPYVNMDVFARSNVSDTEAENPAALKSAKKLLAHYMAEHEHLGLPEDYIQKNLRPNLYQQETKNNIVTVVKKNLVLGSEPVSVSHDPDRSLIELKTDNASSPSLYIKLSPDGDPVHAVYGDQYYTGSDSTNQSLSTVTPEKLKVLLELVKQTSTLKSREGLKEIIQDFSSERKNRIVLEFQPKQRQLVLKRENTAGQQKCVHIEFDNESKPVQATYGKSGDMVIKNPAYRQDRLHYITEAEELGKLMSIIDGFIQRDHGMSVQDYALRKADPSAYHKQQVAKYRREAVPASQVLLDKTAADPLVVDIGYTSSGAPWISYLTDIKMSLYSEVAEDRIIYGDRGQAIIGGHGDKIQARMTSNSGGNGTEISVDTIVDQLKPFVQEGSVSCVLLFSCYAGINGTAKKVSAGLNVPVVAYSQKSTIDQPGLIPEKNLSWWNRKPGIIGMIEPSPRNENPKHGRWIEWLPDGSSYPIGDQPVNDPATVRNREIIMGMAKAISAASDNISGKADKDENSLAADNSSSQTTVNQANPGDGPITDSLVQSASENPDSMVDQQKPGGTEGGKLFDTTDQSKGVGDYNRSASGIKPVERGSGLVNQTVNVSPQDAKPFDKTSPETGTLQQPDQKPVAPTIKPSTIVVGNPAVEEAKPSSEDSALRKIFDVLHPSARGDMKFKTFAKLDPNTIDLLVTRSKQAAVQDATINMHNQKAAIARRLTTDLNEVTQTQQQLTQQTLQRVQANKAQPKQSFETVTLQSKYPAAQIVQDNAVSTKNNIVSANLNGAGSSQQAANTVNVNVAEILMISLKGKQGSVANSYTQTDSIPQYMLRNTGSGVQLQAVTEKSGGELAFITIPNIKIPAGAKATEFNARAQRWDGLPQLSQQQLNNAQAYLQSIQQTMIIPTAPTTGAPVNGAPIGVPGGIPVAP